MFSTSFKYLFVIVSFSLIGCSGEGGGTAGIAVQAVTAAGEPAAGGELAMLDDASTEFTLAAATLNIRDIKLDLPDGLSCGDVESELSGATCSADPLEAEDTIEIEGPFSVDLVTGVAEPTLDDVRIPALTYQRLDIRVDDTGDVAFAALADFELDGDPTVLDLTLDFSEDIRVEGGDGVVIEEDTDLIAELVAADWLAGIDVAACVADGDLNVSSGTVVISEATTEGDCSDIENVIKENMKNSGQLDRL